MKKKGHAAKGHTHKHAASRKHHARTTKHHPKVLGHVIGGNVVGGRAHTKAKHPHHAKGLALVPGDVACCTAEALAASLRLSGWPVGDQDVLALHKLTGADDERGAPILATLEAASAFGLAGCQPYRVIDGSLGHLDVHFGRAGVIEVPHADELSHVGDRVIHESSLILGLDLPGPHAVLATPDGWWSWGELWCPCEFPDAVIEEAWEVSWS